MVAPPDPFMMMEAPPIASEIYSERHQAVFKSLDAVFDAPDAGVTVLPVVELIYTNEAVLTPGIAAELPYSDDEIAMLAKTVWGEARGCSPVEQKLVVWTVFQRVDNGRWGDTIKDVLTAPSQFQGYRARNPVHPDIYALCEAEAADWAQGAAPPTLAPYAPNAPYFYFNGHGGHNWFRAVWRRAS